MAQAKKQDEAEAQTAEEETKTSGMLSPMVGISLSAHWTEVTLALSPEMAAAVNYRIHPDLAGYLRSLAGQMEGYARFLRDLADGKITPPPSSEDMDDALSVADRRIVLARREGWS